MLKLLIRTNKTEGKVPLYTKVRIGEKSVWINLMMDVEISKWKEVSTSALKTKNYLERIGYYKKIQDIEFSIHELKKYNRMSKESIDAAVQTVVLADVRQRVEKERETAKRLEERKRSNIRTFVVNYVDGILKGDVRTTAGENYTPNSLKIWKQFRRIFLDFYDKKTFSWDDINKELADRYTNYLERDCGLMKSTIGRHIGVFRTIVRVAENIGLHKNYNAKNVFHVPQLFEQDKMTEIYLTKDELRALYEMKLTGYEEVVRDVFLIGCYTAQRFSDYGRIDKSCIGVTSKGTKVIRLIQKKTKNKVVIPILAPELETLLEKYDYNVPQIVDVCLNRAIKRICKKLSETVPSLKEKVRTRLSKTERQKEEKAKEKGENLFEYDPEGYVLKPKYQLVMSHTARRTCITLMYLSKSFTTAQMMTVSGHKKESTFRGYIKLSLDEYADDVASASADGLF